MQLHRAAVTSSKGVAVSQKVEQAICKNCGAFILKCCAELFKPKPYDGSTGWCTMGWGFHCPDWRKHEPAPVKEQR